MDRIQTSQPATLSAYWERAGVLTSPGTVTVTVTSDRTGAAILTNRTTTQPTTGQTSVTLTAAQTASLDYLKLVWTALDGSSVTTYAEIVQDYYFSVAAARTMSPLQDTAAYPTQQILDYRTLAELAIEDICGVAFTPRYSRHNARITSMGLLKLPRREIRDVVNIYTSIQGSGNFGIPAYQALPTLAGLRVEPGGLLWIPSFFTWWSTPILVTYEHGYDFVPPRVRRAAMLLMRRWLVESPWDERASGFRTRDGGEMTVLLGSHSDAFDIPEVVALTDTYSPPMVV